MFCPKFNYRLNDTAFPCTDACTNYVERNGTCVDTCESGLYSVTAQNVNMCLDECFFYREVDTEHNLTKCVQQCPQYSEGATCVSSCASGLHYKNVCVSISQCPFVDLDETSCVDACTDSYYVEVAKETGSYHKCVRECPSGMHRIGSQCTTQKLVSNTNAALYTIAGLLIGITAIGLLIHYYKTRQMKTALLKQINPAAQYDSEQKNDGQKKQLTRYTKGRRSEGRKQPLSNSWWNLTM